MLLLEQDTIRKGQVNKLLELESKLDKGEDKEYGFEAIKDSVIYADATESQLLGFYYLVSWKGYWKDKSTWELVSAILHLRKMINIFYKDHPEKSTATFPLLDSAPLMATSTVKRTIKQKYGKLAKIVNETRKAWFYSFQPHVSWICLIM